MLTIGKLGRGQERYYTEKVAEGAEDYYAGEGEAAGYWLGDAAEELGLNGVVDPKKLTAMLSGRSPLTGEPLLSQQGVRGEGPVPGFDLTFSTPKSATLLWALGSRATASEVLAAHQLSVKAALDYMQREACWTRRGAGGSEFMRGNGFIAAAYRHRSSRAGDPQLHTHVLIANATRGPDGRWTRLYHPAIYEHATTASYIYEANLRHELTQRLGVQWQPLRKGIAEIEGFSDVHLREFSKRRAQILEAAGGAQSSARARQVANLATRARKEDTQLSTETLRERWGKRANEIGLDRAVIGATMHRQLPGHNRAVLTVEHLDRAVTAHASHFDRRDAIQAVANLLPNGAPAAEVEKLADSFLSSDAVIRIAETAKGERFTTRRIWELERTALETAQRMRNVGDCARLEEIALERVLAAHPSLKDDQAAMVRALLGDGAGLSVVIGEAGTGKTFATLTAAEGWAQAGIGLTAAAPTWRAANVLRSEGLEATTIASLLGRLDRAESEGRRAMPRNSVLLIDEAGMVDSATLARLIDQAEAAQAKLVLIGDPKQLGEIEAGGLFAALAQRGDPLVLDQVIRHRYEAEGAGTKHIREGEGAAALDIYRSEERVVVAPNEEARREAILTDWWESFGRGDDAVMIAKRNVEVGRLNEMARALMREHGRLGGAQIEVGEASFGVGDQVITRVNDHREQIYNRERWRVTEVDTEQRRIVLEGVDQARRVEVGPDYLARTNPHSDAPALQHAYATTTYSAQGTTVDRAFVIVDPSMDRQELYVAASRSREETYLYATPEIGAMGREEYAPRSAQQRDALEQIAGAVGRDHAQTAAHDEAACSELRKLPNEDLLARRGGLQDELQRESRIRQRHSELQPMITIAEGQHHNALAHLQAVSEASRRQRKRELPGATEREVACRRALERLRAEEVRIGPVSGEARREASAIDQVLAERRVLALTATRLSVPDYIEQELGQLPSDPQNRQSWERGVEAIERYRQEHRVTDRRSALGAAPKTGMEHHDWDAQQRRLAGTQRALGLGQEEVAVRELDQGRGIGIEM